ncbi:MAG: hypothetical protein IMX05_09510 [Hydrogenibacillus schlegelii]|nr:hypothetical protein [Hydrogenibacillus schlegelii]
MRPSSQPLVDQLADALHGAEKTFAVSVLPPNGAYRGYDYGTLGELANTIVLMADDGGRWRTI